MTYFEKYRSRLLSYGVEGVEQKRNIAKKILEKDIKNSPSYYEVTLNQSTVQISTRIITNSKDNRKTLLSLEKAVKGDVVNWDSQKWLILSSDFVGEIYYKSTIELCNNTLHIKTSETKTQTGIDSMGRPVYTITPVYSDFPCIVSSSKSAGYDSNQTINLPSGQLFITIPYTEAIKEGMEFTMYQQKYKVKNVDYSESMNQVGLVTLTVERFV